MSEQEERGFTVVDKRASSGGQDTPAPTEPASPPPSRSDERVPKVDFAMLIASFATGALYHMGIAPDPETGRPSEPNLPLASQNIDILELIEEKTRGNLTPDEAGLLEGLLYEVRMRFVEVSRG
jgi:hypothetical protein